MNYPMTAEQKAKATRPALPRRIVISPAQIEQIAADTKATTK